jgi:hypothetical protein
MLKTSKKISKKKPLFFSGRNGRRKPSSAGEKVDFLLELNRLEDSLLRQVKKEIR